MLRFAPLLLLLFAGCQRPVAAVLTYAPVGVESDEAGSVDMNAVVTVVQQRLRFSRLPCRVSLDDSQNVRIEAFQADQETLDRIEHVVTALGTFELRIAANRADHQELIEQAQGTDKDKILDNEGELLAWWVPIDGGATNAMLSLVDLTTREAQRDGVSDVELLVVNDPYQVNGSLLKRTTPGVDRTGRPNVYFVLSNKGGQMMAGLTGNNLPDTTTGRTRKLAIIFNGRVFSAPAIQSQIRERGEITGDFTEQEVKDLVNVLNSGSLPAPLERVSLEHVGEP